MTEHFTSAAMHIAYLEALELVLNIAGWVIAGVFTIYCGVVFWLDAWHTSLTRTEGEDNDD